MDRHQIRYSSSFIGFYDLYTGILETACRKIYQNEMDPVCHHCYVKWPGVTLAPHHFQQQCWSRNKIWWKISQFLSNSNTAVFQWKGLNSFGINFNWIILVVGFYWLEEKKIYIYQKYIESWFSSLMREMEWRLTSATPFQSSMLNFGIRLITFIQRSLNF